MAVHALLAQATNEKSLVGSVGFGFGTETSVIGTAEKMISDIALMLVALESSLLVFFV